MYLTFKLNFSDLVFFSFLTVCDVASWLENFWRTISSRECHPLNNRNNVYSSTDPRVKTYGVIFCDQFHIIPIWTYLLMTVKPPIFKSSVPQPFGLELHLSSLFSGAPYRSFQILLLLSKLRCSVSTHFQRVYQPTNNNHN